MLITAPEPPSSGSSLALTRGLQLAALTSDGSGQAVTSIAHWVRLSRGLLWGHPGFCEHFLDCCEQVRPAAYFAIYLNWCALDISLHIPHWFFRGDRAFMHIVFTFALFVFILLLDIVNAHYDSCHQTPGFEASTGNCEKTVVLSPKGPSDFASGTTPEDSQHSWTTSFPRSWIPGSDRSQHDGQHPVEVLELSAAAQGDGYLLLQPAVAKCHGQVLCPPASQLQPVCTGLGAGAALGTRMEIGFGITTPEGATTAPATEAEDGWKYTTGQISRPRTWQQSKPAQRQRKRRSSTGTTGTSTSFTLTSNAMAGLRACDDAKSDAPSGTNATYADARRSNYVNACSIWECHDSGTTSTRTKDAGIDELLQATRARFTTGCLPESPRVHQEGWSSSKEGLANGCQSLGRSEGCLGSSFTSQNESDRLLEYIPDRRCPDMEGVWNPLSDTGGRTSGTHAGCEGHPNEVVEVNDDEEDLTGTSNAATPEKITESMQFLTASLHQFQQKAEEIHTEVQSSLKRPRTVPPEAHDAQMQPPNAETQEGGGAPSASLPAAMQPFGAAARPWLKCMAGQGRYGPRRHADRSHPSSSGRTASSMNRPSRLNGRPGKRLEG